MISDLIASLAPTGMTRPQLGKGSLHNNLAFDPTLLEALDEAMKAVRQAVSWGYTFIKHDFSTYELFEK